MHLSPKLSHCELHCVLNSTCWMCQLCPMNIFGGRIQTSSSNPLHPSAPKFLTLCTRPLRRNPGVAIAPIGQLEHCQIGEHFNNEQNGGTNLRDTETPSLASAKAPFTTSGVKILIVPKVSFFPPLSKIPQAQP